MPKEQPELPPFQKQIEVIGEMLNDMVKNKLISLQAVVAFSRDIVCDDLSKMSRKDYKYHYQRIKLLSKVMKAKSMSGGK